MRFSLFIFILFHVFNLFLLIRMSHLVVSIRILSDWRTVLNMYTSAVDFFSDIYIN